MSPGLRSSLIGGGGLLAQITAEKFNVYAGAVVASLTILALFPIVVTRWKKFLKKPSESKSVAPFRE